VRRFADTWREQIAQEIAWHEEDMAAAWQVPRAPARRQRARLSLAGCSLGCRSPTDDRCVTCADAMSAPGQSPLKPEKGGFSF
jgi:hypothetical protein